MRFLKAICGLAGVAALAVMGFVLLDTPEPVTIARPDLSRSELADRGEALLGLAGCVNCHTAKEEGAEPLGGGRPLKTPFGTFYAPNISSDPNEGIGDWSDEDFVRALRYGRRPDGAHYFPAFPYVAYSRMTDADMLAIRNAIMSRPPVDRPNTPHDVAFPFNQRWGMGFWKALHFKPGAFEPDPAKSDAWNRGAYISEALAHCGECHTPRDPTGGLDRTRWMAGTVDGPEGETAPNITPHSGTGIGDWSDGDIRFALSDGLLPDGDVVGSVMYEVVENGTSKLPEADLNAIVEYLRSLPPIENTAAPAAQGY